MYNENVNKIKTIYKLIVTKKEKGTINMAENKVSVDARGAFCPGPLMELMKAAKQAESGTIIELLSNEEGSRKDVPAWAEKTGNEFLGEEQDGDAYKLSVKIK